ncbi:MAG TPA: hypothetical protein VMD59_15060 [Acidimicrobiales bacterium]|nr:hypothetical protein [Acidimicrobiales bacterium]
MSRALLDDHLLRDLLADDVGRGLARVLREHEPASTNLYLYRLSKSIVSARGGPLTGSWRPEQRRELGRILTVLPAAIEVVPIRLLAYRMAEIREVHRVSTLGAEAVAAAELLDAPLCVWEGDDGSGIRSAMAALGARYVTLER